MPNLKRTIRFYFLKSGRTSGRNILLILSLFIGLFSGALALLLKNGVFFLRHLLIDETQFGIRNYLILIYPIIGITLTLILKKYIITDMQKHNIASILDAIARKGSKMKTHKTFSSIIGGMLTAGFGGSVGLESPIISTGAAIGSNIGRILKADYMTVTILLACGSSGAMAAIFNTPIAGVVFALEVLLIDLSRYSLIPLLVASLSGTIVSRIFSNPEVLFDLDVIEKFHLSQIPYFIIFGVIAGFLSFYFTDVFIYIRNKFNKIKKYGNRLLIGSLLLGLLTFIFPPLFGEGFNTIRLILSGDYYDIIDNSIFHTIDRNAIILILFFLFLVFLKVIATSITISAGGVGGVFAPALFMGAVFGFVFAHTINVLDIGIVLSERNFALIGMAALLGGILQAPLTGIFMIIEITVGYELIVPLMMTTVVSFIISKSLAPNSIFTKQLAQQGDLITHHKDNAVLTFMELQKIIEKDFAEIHPEDSLREIVKAVSKSKRNIFPVINDEKKLFGILLLDDIREIMFDNSYYDNTFAHDLMRIPSAVIEKTDKMKTVINKFNKTGSWNLPVTENGYYIGFVSKSRMFNEYRKLLVNISHE